MQNIFLFQQNNLSAEPILNVPITLHVFKNVVKTHAIPTLVEPMQNAVFQIIDLHVLVEWDLLEILTQYALSVRHQFTFIITA